MGFRVFRFKVFRVSVFFIRFRVYPRYTSYFWTEKLKGVANTTISVTAASRRGVDRLSEPIDAGFRVKTLRIQERSP